MLFQEGTDQYFISVIEKDKVTMPLVSPFTANSNLSQEMPFLRTYIYNKKDHSEASVEKKKSGERLISPEQANHI